MELRGHVLILAQRIRKRSGHHDILADRPGDIRRFVQPIQNGDIDNEADKHELKNNLDTLHEHLVKAFIPEIAQEYSKANRDRTFAFIAGDTNVSGATVFNIGGSLSELYPLAKRLSDGNGVSGVGWLVSAQQEFISFGPGIDTSITRYGLAAAWQDRVATEKHPYDRWRALVGAEYVFRTVLDRSATYDVFARFRPYYRTNHGGYVPLDFTVFGGVGPSGSGFLGARMGFGFSL